MKDAVGVMGLLLLSGGCGWMYAPLSLVAAGGVLVLWATIEELKNDR